MKTVFAFLVLLQLNLAVTGQHIKNPNEAALVKKIVDQQANLKSFVIAPTIFNNKGQTFPGKFSYKFFYDTTSSLLVKVEIVEAENNNATEMYFSNEQLAVVTSKN